MQSTGLFNHKLQKVIESKDVQRLRSMIGALQDSLNKNNLTSNKGKEESKRRLSLLKSVEHQLRKGEKVTLVLPENQSEDEKKRQFVVDTLCQDTQDAIQFDEKVVKKYLVTQASAKKRSLEFALTFDTIRRLMKQKTCSYTGKRFSSSIKRLERTFERVDDSKGYVEGNVIAVTFEANQLKNILFEQNPALSLTPKQLIKLAKHVENNRNNVKKEK